MNTEELFRQQLRRESDALDQPVSGPVVHRAVGEGRRRVRRRTVARVGAGVAIAGVLVSVPVVVTSAGGGGARTAGPAATVPFSASPQEIGLPAVPSTPPATAPAPSKPVPKNPLADEIAPVLMSLLPDGAKNPKSSDTSPDARISAVVSWDTGAGVVEVSAALANKDLFGCRPGGDSWSTTTQRPPGVSITCVTLPDGTLIEREIIPGPEDSDPEWRATSLVFEDTVIRIAYANGPLTVPGVLTRATQPLTEEQALAIARSPEWTGLVEAFQK